MPKIEESVWFLVAWLALFFAAQAEERSYNRKTWRPQWERIDKQTITRHSKKCVGVGRRCCEAHRMARAQLVIRVVREDIAGEGTF